MRMPHLMLVVVLFLGIVSLLAHQPQGEHAYAEEAFFISMAEKALDPDPPADVLRQCRDQARAEGVASEAIAEYLERCAASAIVKQALME
jgi:hypothetical protein